MNATTLEKQIELYGQLYDVFAEVDVNVSRGGFEYGFGGQRQTETEVSVEVTGFSAKNDAGQEVEDKAILRALAPLVDAAAERQTERLAERIAA